VIFRIFKKLVKGRFPLAGSEMKEMRQCLNEATIQSHLGPLALLCASSVDLP